MSILLTIGVPTYNRAEELTACLHSIGAALARLTEAQRTQVAVLVSDNASSDGTEAALEAHCESFPWLRCHRNPENIGAEANFYTLVQKAESRYVWILGDDDRLKPNALSVALGLLADDESQPGFDLLICNCSTHTPKFTALRAARRFPGTENRPFDAPEDVMKTFGIELGYISIQVFRRSRFLAVPLEDYQAFAEYGHSFMFAIYAGLLPRFRTLFVAEPLICSQGDASAGFDWYQIFAVGTARVFDKLQALGYSPKSVLAGKHQALRAAILPHTLVCRRDGIAVRPDLFRLLLPHYRNNWFFWVSLPSLLLPRGVVRFLDALFLRPRRRSAA